MVFQNRRAGVLAYGRNRKSRGKRLREE